MRAAAVLLGAALLAGCGPDCTPGAGERAPIVLLVTVDTLRADHLGSYGSTRVRTPVLDRLGAEGVRFANAYAASNTTLPSHTTLFTAQPLARHGILSNHATTGTVAGTVFDRLRAAGYPTAAFVSAYHLGPKMLFGSLLPDLTRFDAPRRVSKPFLAAETVDRTLDWVRTVCRGSAFGWVHLWDPHMPYAPPAPFDRAYYDGDPRDPAHRTLVGVEFDWILHDLSGLRRRLAPHAGAVRTLKRRLGVSSRQARSLILYPDALRSAAPDPATYQALLETTRPVMADLHRRLPFAERFASFLAGVRDVEYPRALYAGEVSYVDRELGRLLDTLESWGLRDRLVLVVTSDHGEGLGDHGIYFNHVGLWEEMLRVPLVVWAPGRVAPRVREEPAMGIDVAPTLLRLLDLDVPAWMEGRDLLAPSLPPRDVVAESVRRFQVALLAERWKLVRTLKGYWITGAFHRDAGDVELYDLAADPGELTDLAAREPARVRELGARLDAWLVARGVAPDGTVAAEPAPAVSPADRERLRALGYVE